MTHWKKTLGLIACAAVVTITGVAAFGGPVYMVAYRDGDGQLIWNESEIYVFVRTGRLGWERSVGAVLRDWLRELVGTGLTPAAPTHVTRGVLFVHISDTGIRTHNVNDVRATDFSIADGVVYMHDGPAILRCTGTGIERIKSEHLEQFQARRIAAHNLHDVNGWNARSNILSQPDTARYTISTSGTQWTVIAHNRTLATRSKAIDVQMNGRTAERVWHIDMNPKFVSANEFQRFLEK